MRLERENVDLRIANRGKDTLLDEFRRERESFAAERNEYVEKLMTFNHRLGEFETRVFQLGESTPPPQHVRRIHVISERDYQDRMLCETCAATSATSALSRRNSPQSDNWRLRYERLLS